MPLENPFYTAEMQGAFAAPFDRAVRARARAA